MISRPSASASSALRAIQATARSSDTCGFSTAFRLRDAVGVIGEPRMSERTPIGQPLDDLRSKRTGAGETRLTQPFRLLMHRPCSITQKKLMAHRECRPLNHHHHAGRNSSGDGNNPQPDRRDHTRWSDAALVETPPIIAGQDSERFKSVDAPMSYAAERRLS